MAKHRSTVSLFCRTQNVGSACNAGGSSSLHTRINAAACLIHSNGPENLPPFPSAGVRHKANASTGTPSAAHSTAHAPLQPHLHFLHATPRHTLHYPRSPAPRRPVDHVHTGRRGNQTLARERHTAEHNAQSTTREKRAENVTEGRRWFLQTVMLKKPRLAFDELERAYDVSVELRGRLQFTVDNEGKCQMSASESIGKCEKVGRRGGG